MQHWFQSQKPCTSHTLWIHSRIRDIGNLPTIAHQVSIIKHFLLGSPAWIMVRNTGFQVYPRLKLNLAQNLHPVCDNSIKQEHRHGYGPTDCEKKVDA
jgi:hypothetical protein